MRRRFLILFLMLLGCSALRAQYARESTLQRELDAYVIPKPLPEVWQSVTSVNGPYDNLLWSGRGFTWSDDGPWKKRTSSKTEEYEASGDHVTRVNWYECEGVEAPNGSQVRYFEVTESTTRREGRDLGTQKNVERRTDLELELVKRFDAAAAQRIQAAADKAAAAAE